MEYHSHITTPNNVVIDSLLASMCIPGIFAPVYINNQCYIDGAVVNSFPIDMFNDREHTLGFLLTRPTLIFNNFSEYLFSIFNLSTKKCLIDNDNIIEISTDNISRLNWLSNEDQLKLISNGKKNTINFFNKSIKIHLIVLCIIHSILMFKV
jgi:predicted acylesterase/phospholipase RssA